MNEHIKYKKHFLEKWFMWQTETTDGENKEK